MTHALRTAFTLTFTITASASLPRPAAADYQEFVKYFGQTVTPQTLCTAGLYDYFPPGAPDNQINGEDLSAGNTPEHTELGVPYAPLDRPECQAPPTFTCPTASVMQASLNAVRPGWNVNNSLAAMLGPYEPVLMHNSSSGDRACVIACNTALPPQADQRVKAFRLLNTNGTFTIAGQSAFFSVNPSAGSYYPSLASAGDLLTFCKKPIITQPLTNLAQSHVNPPATVNTVAPLTTTQVQQANTTVMTANNETLITTHAQSPGGRRVCTQTHQLLPAECGYIHNSANTDNFNYPDHTASVQVRINSQIGYTCTGGGSPPSTTWTAMNHALLNVMVDADSAAYPYAAGNLKWKTCVDKCEGLHPVYEEHTSPRFYELLEMVGLYFPGRTTTREDVISAVDGLCPGFAAAVAEVQP